MKYRFLVFESIEYYPAGGMDDCMFKTDSASNTISQMKNNSTYHCYDCKTGETYYDSRELAKALEMEES